MGVARLGREDQRLVAAPLATFAAGLDMGPPLHSLVIAGDMHPIEEEAMALLRAV